MYIIWLRHVAMYIRDFELAETRCGFVNIFNLWFFSIFDFLKHYVSPEDPKLFCRPKLYSNSIELALFLKIMMTWWPDENVYVCISFWGVKIKLYAKM
jgi:hypothetical protein